MVAKHISVALPALWGELFNAWKNYKHWHQQMHAVEKSLTHSLWFKVAMKYCLDYATVSRFMDWIKNAGADIRKLSPEQLDLLYRAWNSVFRADEVKEGQ